VVFLDGLLLYTHRHEIAVEEPGHAPEPFAEQSSESHAAAAGGVWKPAGYLARSACEGLNPHRTASDSPAASFNLRLSEILPEPARTPGWFRGEDLG
jgi:hypothetical protein